MITSNAWRTILMFVISNRLMFLSLSMLVCTVVGAGVGVGVVGFHMPSWCLLYGARTLGSIFFFLIKLPNIL